MKSLLSGLVGLLVVVASGAARAQDPSAPGPFSVLTAEYCCADAATCGVEGGGSPPLACNPTVFSCPAADGCNAPNSELRAEVYYPSNLAAGPFPLLVFLHGNHSVCYDRSTGNTTFTWPCPAPFEPIPNYRGYDYIGRVLASHGYIVASLSTNGIIAHTSGPARGIQDRAHVIDQHFKIWNTFSTTGSTVNAAPFAADFIGHVDLHRAGTMGHSRGGDGVVRNYFRFAGSPDYTVRAVLPIAPTNVPGSVINNVDLGVLLGYCDGDVDTLEGTLFFDRARYVVAGDQSSKFTFLTRGANHNFFNTVWTPLCWTSGTCWADDRGARPANGATSDDATQGPDFPDFGAFSGDPFCDPTEVGDGRITEEQQRAVGLAYVAAFFRYSIGGETAFLPMLRGDVAAPGGVDPAHVGYLPPEAKRRDLNRFNTDAERTTNTLGGAVTLNGAPIPVAQRCGYDHGNPCFPLAAREAHLSNFAFQSDPTLSRVRIPWSSSSTTLVNEIPAASRDVSGFDTLQFRAGVDYLVSQPSPVQFSVILQGASGSVSTSAQLGVNDLFLPLSTSEPTTVMNTVRLPLSLFTGANLADVQSVTIQFDGTPTGSVLFSDMAFAGQPDNPAGAFPSADPGDGKLMLVSGQGVATVDIPDTSLFIAVPGGQSTLSVSIFDGDQTGGFDFTSGDPTNTCYRLVTDGNKNGVFEPGAPQNEEVVAIQSDSFFTNNAYTFLYPPGPLHASAFNAAANASFYRLEVSTGPGAPTATDCPLVDATKTILQGFKVKATGQVSIEYGDFSFMGADAAGPFASPNPFTSGGINTTYNGAWDYYVSVPTVGTPPNVNFRDSDADFLNDVDNPGVADGANEEIQYLVFKTNGEVFVNSDVSGNFDFLSGANDDETQAVPSGGVGGVWRWRWNNVLTENNIHVWPPTFSPARAAVYAVPVVPLKVTAAKPLEYWLDHPDQIDDLLPIRLGTHRSGLKVQDLHDALCILDEMQGDHSRKRHGGFGRCNRCDPLCGFSRHDGNSHHGHFDESHGFDRFHRPHGRPHGRHHEPSELLRDLIIELLVAELNVALDASFGQDLTLGFVYGRDESIAEVLAMADHILSKGVRFCKIPHDLVDDTESVIALLETINAGEVTFVSPLLDPATPTLPQFFLGRRSVVQSGRAY